jgi:hypothetical protein
LPWRGSRRQRLAGLGLTVLLPLTAAAPSAAAPTRIVRVAATCTDARAALVVELRRSAAGSAAATLAVFRGTEGRGRRIGGARLRFSGPREQVRMALPATVLDADCELPADEPLVLVVRVREASGAERVLRRPLRPDPAHAADAPPADPPAARTPTDPAPGPAPIVAPAAPESAAPTPAPQAPAPARAVATRSRHAGLVPAPVVEASGLVWGAVNPDHWWTLNDSGGAAALYALDGAGRVAATLTLPGVANVDWEDLASGPAPGGGRFLYVADLGDNAAARAAIRVHRVPEPDLTGLAPGTTLAAASVQTVTLRYPDGARDAEALVVDPLTGDLYVITKREARSRVYRAAAPPFAAGGAAVLELVGELPFGGVVAADTCPDGQTVLVKTYGAIWAFVAEPGLAAALATAPAARRYDGEPQGETIAAAPDCRGYATLSENAPRATPQPLVVYDGG